MSLRRNFPLLLASQYLGAFGDNAILAVILGQLTFQQQAGRITESELSAANAIYTSLLFVPYVLLAPLAGYLNDRHAKTRWLAGGNVIKLAGTALAMLSVWQGSFWQGLGYLVVGVGGCFYSPAKYGILPEIVARERLVKANGAVEFLTIVAILTGYLGGAAMIDHLSVPVCYAILVGIYGASLGLNLLMAATPAHPGVRLKRSVDEFFANFGGLLANPRLFRVLCGCGLFWLCGAGMKINFQPWGLQVLKLENNTQIALLGLWLSLGIMGGSLLAGRLHRVGDLRGLRRYGWGMAGLVALLGLVESLMGVGFLTTRGPVIAILILTGTLAGLFLIPLNAALQNECDPGRLGKTVAAQNVVDNLAMVAAGSLILVAAKASVNPSAVFLYLAAIVALVVTILKVPPRAQPTGEGVEPGI
jgi:LPLT family lysophospholipid transporter-like MFS transporter